MASQGFSAHVDPGGATLPTRLRAAGFVPHSGTWAAGEVLGFGSTAEGTPRGLVRGWLASPPHLAILRDRQCNRIGVGVARGTPSGADGLTSAVEFGRR